MNKVRTLIAQIPYIAGCEDADRFSKRNVMLFDFEVANKESVFAFRDSDKINNRIAVLEIPSEYVKNPKEYRYAMDRLKLVMLAQDNKEDRITDYGKSTLTYMSEATPEVTEDAKVVDSILSGTEAVGGVWF